MTVSEQGFGVMRLTPRDVNALLELNRLFGQVFEDSETYTGNSPSTFYLEGLLKDSGFIALIAAGSQGIIGGLVAYELKKFEQRRSEFYIYDLAVREDCRRQGVATALIETLQRIAAENDGWVVFVQADHGDDPAIALYTKLGRREDVLHFDIDVG